MDIELKPLPEERRASQERRQYAPPPPPGNGRTFLQSCLVAGCATLLAPFVLVAGFFVFIYVLAAPGIGEAGGALETLYQGSSVSNLREKVVRPGKPGAGSIAIVAIQGAIDGNGSTLEGSGTLGQVAEQLRAVAEDDTIKAVILQIDSPGGGLSASDQLYNEVRNLRSKGKKVIAWAGGMMASGGYYIAVAAEGIIASPTATIGSIGVVLSHFQVQDLMKMIGVRANPITSAEHKDIGSPFREMTQEERRILQDYIDVAHRRFVDLVAKGRNLEYDAADALANGSIYHAEAAQAHGLVDRIGYIEDAVAWAEELTGAKDMRVVSYRRLFSWGDVFREAGRGAAETAVEATTPDRTPRAMAIWER